MNERVAGDMGTRQALADLIVRSATDFAIVTSNLDARITSWSPGAENVLGWTAGEAVGEPVDLFFTPEDRAAGQVQKEMEVARAKGCATDERYHLKKDGSRFWASGELQPLREGGAIVGFVKILRDRSEHRALEEQLATARSTAELAASQVRVDNDRLRALFEGAPGFIAIFSGPDHRCELVNSAYLELVGDRDLVGRPIREALPELEGQGFFEMFDRAFTQGEQIRGHEAAVMLSRDPGGRCEERFVDFVFQPIRDVEGAVTGIFLEGFDTTDAVRSRESAAKVAAEQEAILSQLGEGVIATDAAGRIRFVNKAAERLHGVARLDVAPEEYSDTYHLLTEAGEPYPPADLPLTRAVGGETVCDARWRIRRPDGSEVLAIGNAQPVLADGIQVGAVLTVRDDTARRDAESALSSSRRSLRLLLDSAQEAFYSVDTAGATTLCNAAFLELLGFESEKDVLGRKLHDVIHHTHPDGGTYAKEDCPIYQCAQSGTPAVVSDEYFYKLDGTPIPVEYRVSPIRSDGVLSGAICTFVDISERKATEQALRETEERYRLAGRATNDAIWDWDFETNSVLWNEALHTVFGHAPDAVDPTGEWWIENIHPDDRATVDVSIHAAIDGDGTAWTGEYRFRRGDGSYADVFDRGTVIRDADGRAVRMIGAMLDLSERNAAEAAVRRSEAQFRELADNIPVLCWTAHSDGSIFWYNQRWYDYTGATPESELGWGWEQVHHPDYLPLVSENWANSLASCEPFEMVFPLRRADGVFRHFLTRVEPIRGEDGKVVRWLGTNSDIEDRKVAEDALKESEARFRRIADSSPVSMWVTGTDRRREFVNRSYVDFLDISYEEAVGFDWRTIIHPDDAARIVKESIAGEASGEAFVLEGRYRNKAGQYRWLRSTSQPRLGPGGVPNGFIGVAHDITDAKEAEDALRLETRTLETLNGVFASVAGELDLERVVQMVTDAGVEISGAQFGAFFYNKIDPDGGEMLLYTLSGIEREAFAGFGMPRATAIFHPTLSGEGVVRSDDIDKDPRYGLSAPHHGMPAGHVPVRSYLAVPVVSRSGDPIGGLFFGHREAARFDARHERLLVGIAAQAAISIDNARLFDAAQREIAERRNAESALTELNRTLETRVAEAIAERETAEEQLRQSQKMEAVGQLTGGIAHDFNNLLTIVSGNIDMARRALGDKGDPRAIRAIGNAMKGADRAAALTQRLLAFSRRQPLQPRATDVNRLLAGMTELLDRALGETIDLQVVTGAGLWRVEVDPNQLENAILNLAVNARDAMPGGGKLTIETVNSAIDSAYSEQHREVAPGQYVLISVTDTGEGMSSATLGKAFDPFFSTKEVGKGTGLGLSQVYGYVKQSGGHVKIYSEEGEGTTVKLYLPRLIADMNATDEEPEANERAAHGQESILVVEDDDDVRIFTVESLRELGYRVLEAHDGASALRLLERQDDPVCLLLTDVVMPGMSGRDLADRARDAWPDLRVLYTTGYARNAIVHGGRLDPGVELLPKPFTLEALAAKVREVIDRGAAERALVIDGDEKEREEKSALLAEIGFSCEVAATVREALGKLRAGAGIFDVAVISDALQVGNLEAVVTELRAIRDDLPLLIVATGEAEALARRLKDDKCLAVIAGPMNAAALREALARLRLTCAPDQPGRGP